MEVLLLGYRFPEMETEAQRSGVVSPTSRPKSRWILQLGKARAASKGGCSGSTGGLSLRNESRNNTWTLQNNIRSWLISKTVSRKDAQCHDFQEQPHLLSKSEASGRPACGIRGLRDHAPYTDISEHTVLFAKLVVISVIIHNVF